GLWGSARGGGGWGGGAGAGGGGAPLRAAGAGAPPATPGQAPTAARAVWLERKKRARELRKLPPGPTRRPPETEGHEPMYPTPSLVPQQECLFPYQGKRI